MPVFVLLVVENIEFSAKSFHLELLKEFSWMLYSIAGSASGLSDCSIDTSVCSKSSKSLRLCCCLYDLNLEMMSETFGASKSFFQSSSTRSSRFLFASCLMWAVVSLGSWVSREFRMKFIRFIIITSIVLFKSIEFECFLWLTGLPVSRFGRVYCSVCFWSKCCKLNCSRE